MNTHKKSIKLPLIIFIICLVFATGKPIQAQTGITTLPTEELKLGLVLSGGGAKGFAHIGVLKVFEEENIPITLITGNSIGTIVGALYSIGYSAQDIEEFTKKQDWGVLLSDGVERRLKSRFKQNFEHKYFLKLGINKEEKKLSFPSGLIVGNNILNVLCGNTVAFHDSINFSELPIPFYCVAYNLDTGKEEVLDQGYLAKAMLASMAFPGVFSPIKIDDMILLDGGIINNFPVNVAKDKGADIIIGVDLKQVIDKGTQLESFPSIVKEIVVNIEVDKHNENVALADVVINPKLDGVSTFNFEKISIDSIIKIGEMAAREQLPKIRELIKNKNIKQNNSFDKDQKKEWLITEIRIPKKHKADSQFITSRLNLENNNKYTINDIENATKRVFAYGNFETVTYKLIPNTDGYTLDLLIEDTKEKRVMLGAAFNTVDIATFYANFSQQNYSNILSLVMLDAKIAVNPQLRFIMETHRLFFPTVGLEISARYHKLNYYQKGERLGKMDVGSASIDLYTYRRIHEVFDMGFGLKRTFSTSDDYIPPELNGLFETSFSGFSTSLYGYFTIDNRDDAIIPNKGTYINSRFSLLENKGGFSNIIPILDFKLNTTIPFGNIVSVLANVYHRSIFKIDRYPLSSVNYASNGLNAFNDFYFPVLGQSGISFLEPVSTLGELGIRFDIGNKHFITPKIQALLQFDKWDNIDLNDSKWGAGISYQTQTKLGPIDFTLGVREMAKGVNFHGGIGYMF